MRPSLDQVQHVFERIKPALLPIISLIACTVQSFKTPVRHSLFVNAIAWLVVYVVCAQRVGVRDGIGDAQKRKYCLLSGVLYALALGAERAAVDKEGLAAPQV
jgi:hypothetical protein